MVESKRQEEWLHTSALMALVSSMAGGRGDPDDFNPTIDRQKQIESAPVMGFKWASHRRIEA